MKKFFISASLVFCVAIGVVACSSDSDSVVPPIEIKVPEDGSETGKVTAGNLKGKWRIVKSIEYDKSNAIVREEIKSNGECSTESANFFDNNKVVFNNYARVENGCEIMDEYDGRWNVVGQDVMISEDWRDTPDERKVKRFSVITITADTLELSYDLAQGNLTEVNTIKETTKIVFSFEKVKRK